MKNDFCSFNLSGETLYINIEDSFDPPDEMFNETLDMFFKSINNLEKPTCLILNIDNLIILEFYKIKKFYKTFLKLREKIDKILIATAVICSSFMGKTMMNLFLTFYTPARPYKVFSSDENYKDFLKDEYSKFYN